MDFKDKFYEVCKQLELVNDSFPLLIMQIPNHHFFKARYNEILNTDSEVEKIVQRYLMDMKFILDVNGLPFEMQNVIRTASDFPFIIQIVYEYKRGIYTDVGKHYATKTEAPYYLAKAKDLFFPDWMVIQENFGVSKNELLEKWFKIFIKKINTELNNVIEKELSELEKELTKRIEEIYKK
ncbi:hypothetical protein [Bacillus sp. Brlt_9]|uniref:hypothetical protein n=1 Tax=Bacillus sp. Brlt_9 TaxID=3110916 RepID=UPI003F7C7D45